MFFSSAAFASLITLIAALIVLGISCFIPRKVRILRYGLWVLALCILGTLFMKPSWVRDIEIEYAGDFRVDTARSHYGNIIWHNYADAFLHVDADNTFRLKKDLPFFPAARGKWEYFDNGDFGYTESSFDGDNSKWTIDISQHEWIFRPLTEGKSTMADSIVFVRISTAP